MAEMHSEHSDLENDHRSLKEEFDFYKKRRDHLNDALGAVFLDFTHAPEDAELQALINEKWSSIQTSRKEVDQHISNLSGKLKEERVKNLQEWWRLEQQCETLMSEIQKRKEDMTPEEYDTAMEQLSDANERRIILDAELDEEYKKLAA